MFRQKTAPNTPFSFAAKERVYCKHVNGLTVEVYETADLRTLQFGNNVIQSAMWLNNPTALALAYTQCMAGVLWFQSSPSNALHIGLGGGSLPRFFHTHCPALQQTIVELKPGVVEVADKFFPLPATPNIDVVVTDGETFLANTKTTYDIIILDAFFANGSPPNMLALSTLQNTANSLQPDGWLVINAWGSQTTVLKKLKKTVRNIFAHTYQMSVRLESNIILLCAHQTTRPPNTTQLQRKATFWQERTGIPFKEMLPSLNLL